MVGIVLSQVLLAVKRFVKQNNSNKTLYTFLKKWFILISSGPIMNKRTRKVVKNV